MFLVFKRVHSHRRSWWASKMPTGFFVRDVYTKKEITNAVKTGEKAYWSLERQAVVTALTVAAEFVTSLPAGRRGR